MPQADKRHAIGVTRQLVWPSATSDAGHRAPLWCSGHLTVSAIDKALLCDGGTPPTAASSRTGRRADKWCPRFHANFKSIYSSHPPPIGPRHGSRVCCLLAQSAPRKQTPHRAPERRPDAATSAMPPGSPRPVPLRGQAGRPVCRVGMSPLSGPRSRRPCPDPERLSSGLALHVSPLQRRSPRIGRDVASAPSGNPLRWIAGPSQQSTPRRWGPVSSPSHPRSGFLPQSRRRDMPAGDRSAK